MSTDAKLSRPNPYRWYDSWWLADYFEAQKIIQRLKPEALADFIRALEPLQTNRAFRTTLLDQPFDADTLDAVRKVVKSLRPSDSRAPLRRAPSGGSSFTITRCFSSCSGARSRSSAMPSASPSKRATAS